MFFQLIYDSMGFLKKSPSGPIQLLILVLYTTKWMFCVLINLSIRDKLFTWFKYLYSTIYWNFSFFLNYYQVFAIHISFPVQLLPFVSLTLVPNAHSFSHHRAVKRIIVYSNTGYGWKNNYYYSAWMLDHFLEASLFSSLNLGYTVVRKLGGNNEDFGHEVSRSLIKSRKVS